MNSFTEICQFNQNFLSAPCANDSYILASLKALVRQNLSLLATIQESLYPHFLSSAIGYDLVADQSRNFKSTFYLMKVWMSFDEEKEMIEFLFASFAEKKAKILWEEFIEASDNTHIVPFPIKYL